MQPSPPNIDELLTGMLDGNLSERELRQLEAAMAADSTLEKQLVTLRKMRSDLLTHRPKGRLGADFAKRVTALAEARAKSEASQRSAPVPAPSLRLAPWIYTGAVSVAVIAFVLVMIPSAPMVQPQNLTAKIPLEIPAETQTGAADDVPHVEPLESQPQVSKPLIAEGATRKSNPTTVIQELEQSNSLAGVLPPTQGKDAQKKDFVGNPTSTTNDESSKVVSKPKGKQANEQILNEAKAKLQAGNPAENFYVLVVDISISKDAVEKRTLEAILSRHDIASTEEQVLTSDEMSNLEKTGLASKAPGGGTGGIGLIFVRAPATNVDNAIREINQEQLAFPDFRMGMQFDDSLKSFVKELSQIRVVAERKGQARFLRSEASESLMSFSPGSIELPRPKRRAEKSGKAAALKVDLRTMSNALLIIRSAN